MASIRTNADQIRSLKASLPKGSPDNVIIIQNGRQPHLYMCTSCHGWKCHCDVPRTTRRYTMDKQYRDPLHLESTVFEGGFVVPNTVRKAWSSEPGTVEAPRGRGQGQKKTVSIDEETRELGKVKDKLRLKENTDVNIQTKQKRIDGNKESNVAINDSNGSIQTNRIYGNKDSNAARNAHTADTDTEPIETIRRRRKRITKHRVIIDLSVAPITARSPFRVSTAHWASRSHTQQWPWKGGLQCKLLSQDGQLHQSYSRHTQCSIKAAKHKH